MMLKSDTLLVGADGYIGSNCPFSAMPLDLNLGQDFLQTKPFKVDTIIFLAARLDSSRESYLYNESLYIKLDDWLAEFPDTHVIYASSAAVYGEGEQPQREFYLPEPLNRYGKSKLSGEFHVREYRSHTVLRFANVYGQMKGKKGHGVTELFQSGHKLIFGDGEQVRDFVPIREIWRVIALARKFPHHWQGVFNVSQSNPVTITDWYDKHGQGFPQYVGEREGDIYTSILDNTKMKRSLSLCM